MSFRVDLDWTGPSPFMRNTFDDLEDVPGCYIWTIELGGCYRVVYVGETAGILTRWSQHLMWLLGGGYWVYEPEELRKDNFVPIYKSEGRRHLNEFTTFHMDKARQYADLLQFWYARLDDNRFLHQGWRKSVESALISQLKKAGHDKANLRLSKAQENAYKIECVCRWPAGVNVLGLSGDQLIAYGVKDGET